MLKQDYVLFTTALDNACMDIGKEPMTSERRKSLFERYQGFDIATMQAAIFAASGDEQVSFSGITPAILNKHLGVKALVDLEWGDVLAHAKLKQSPMGILALLHIGSYDLREKSNLDNMVAAKEFLLKLPKVAADLNAGIIDKHELTIMHKYGVWPDRVPFMPGLPLPFNAQALAARTNEVMQLESYKVHNENQESENLAINNDGLLRIAGELSKISASIPNEKPQITDNTAELKEEFGQKLKEVE